MRREQILVGVLIANVHLDSIDKERRPGLICKLDLESRYDRLDRGSLRCMKGTFVLQPKSLVTGDFPKTSDFRIGGGENGTWDLH